MTGDARRDRNGGAGTRRWLGPAVVVIALVAGIALLWPRGGAPAGVAAGSPGAGSAAAGSAAVGASSDPDTTAGPTGPGGSTEPGGSSASAAPPAKPGHETYGFVPYWMMGDAIADHLARTDLSTVALFSVTHGKSGAMATGQRGYQRITSDIGRRLVREAHDRKARVDLTYTSFGASKNQAFYDSPDAQARWIRELVAFTVANDFDGINVDVESMPLADVPAYGAFVGRLRVALRDEAPKATVTVSTTSGPKGAAMAAAAAAAGIDRIFLMGYDYHYEGSEPGASAPLDSFDGSSGSLRSSLDLYATVGVPMERVLLGLPLYGVQWPVVGPEIGAPSTDSGNEWIPSLNLGVFDRPKFKPTYEPIQSVEFYAVEKPADPSAAPPAGGSAEPDATQWHAVYYDSPRSLTPKLALADERGLAGAGFWAIGFERGVPGYSALIHRFREGQIRDARLTTADVLSDGQLNRATLARQLLLERAQLDAVAGVHAIAGLQAQEPASPYIGLWTRLDGFAVADLDAAFVARDVVKATLMRSTLHAVTAADYRCFLPAVAPMLQGIRRQDRVQPPPPEELERLRGIAATFTSEPRSLTALREHLVEHVGDRPTDEVVWWLRRQATYIHAPAGDPWSFGRRPLLVDAASWLGDDSPFASVDEALDHLARRYLAAFGPATAADLGQWSGVAIGRLRPALDRLEAGGETRRFADERRKVLFDLVDAPRPPATVPAPPRLLPMWDSVLLAHADRTRVISDADRAIVIAKNGDTLPTFTVDGRIAGLWWAERETADADPHIVLDPFRAIPSAARRALAREGESLAAFISPHEPTVYRRYQRWRPGH